MDIETRKLIIGGMINLRGSYVHEGLSNVMNDRLNGLENLTELEAYKKIVARFLSRAFELTENCRLEASVNGNDIEEIWYQSFQT